MRQVYNRSSTVTFNTGDSGYVFSERIDPGCILHVHSCFGYSPQRTEGENVIIGIDDGGPGVILQAKAALTQQRGAAVETDFFVGEGDRVYAIFPNAGNGDSIGIHLSGVLQYLEDWKKGME